MNVNDFLDCLMRLYARLLHLYPDRFRKEFAEEMQVVFQDSVKGAGGNGRLSMIFICLRELGGLPLSILREFWHELERKETVMVTNEKVEVKPAATTAAGRWDALLGALPYTLFGIAVMIGKSELPIHGEIPFISFFLAVLTGLTIGLVKQFPRWSYSYLGWAAVNSWWFMGMPLDTFRNTYPPITHNQLLGWWSWLPFLIAAGTGLIMARSFDPLRRLAESIWRDWTNLSLAMYALAGFALLIYDENHSPYLYAFMAVSTLVFTGSVWIFFRSASIKKRFLSLAVGFLLGIILSLTCDLTWDWNAYYNLPASPPEPWYTESIRYIAFTVVWSAMLFWPALLGLIRRIINNRQKPVMPA